MNRVVGVFIASGRIVDLETLLAATNMISVLAIISFGYSLSKTLHKKHISLHLGWWNWKHFYLSNLIYASEYCKLTAGGTPYITHDTG